MEQLSKNLPVSILLTTYNRLNFLKKTVESINQRTLYPYRLIIVSNHCTDGTLQYLKESKVNGKIWDYLYLDENLGQSVALNKGVALVNDWENNRRRPSSDWVITTNEDIYPPMLIENGSNCWLEQMIILFQKYENDGLGALAMRIERTARAEIDESQELIYFRKGIPSVFRLMRRSDLNKMGVEPFGHLKHFDSNATADNYQTVLKKKIALTTHIYASHFGFNYENKGYDLNDKNYFTYSGEAKLQVFKEKPYPEIDPETQVPIKINHGCDGYEQRKRDEYQARIDGKVQPNDATIIVLTCHRYKQFLKLIESIKQYTNIKYDLLVVADHDDTEAYNYCVEHDIDCILANKQRDFVAQANLGIYASQTPYFMILADDMEICEEGWLAKALEIFKVKFPDNLGLLAVNDGIQNGRIFTSGLSSKKFVNSLGGYLYYPLYIHYGGDNEVSALAKALNQYHYAEEVKVIHHHPTNKNSELAGLSDETYENSMIYNHWDQRLKRKRKGNMEQLIKDKNYCDYLN
jgi:glycosyltransferase involved in cell wall biosynthesis